MMTAWAALIGGKGDDRAGATVALAARLAGLGLRVGGFVPRPAEPEREGRPPGLLLEDLATGQRIRLAHGDERDPDLCSYRFDPAAFACAAAWVEAPLLDVALLGGLGAFEAAGRGHFHLIERLLARARPLPVLVVRRDSLARLALALPDPAAALELPAGEADLDAFAATLLSLIRAEE